MDNPHAFYALEPRWLTRDFFYKIYVTERDLRGVLLGRQVYDENSAFRQMIGPAQIFAPLMRRWADRILENICRREEYYDGIVLVSDAFLEHDPRNFQIFKADILSLRANSKKRLWTGFSKIGGTLWLQTSDRSREWIIVGDQDLNSIATCLGYPHAAGG